MAQQDGTIRWFNNARGYRFLTQDDGPDLFVQSNSVQSPDFKSLKEGKSTQHDDMQGKKRPQAVQMALKLKN